VGNSSGGRCLACRRCESGPGGEGNKTRGVGVCPCIRVLVLVLFDSRCSVPGARSLVHTGKRRRRSLSSARRSSGRSQERGALGSWTDRRLRRQERGECSREWGWGLHWRQKQWKHTPSSYPSPLFSNNLHHGHWWESPTASGLSADSPAHTAFPRVTGYVQQPEIFILSAFTLPGSHFFSYTKVSRISFSGDIPDPPGQGPLQPAVGDPASAGGLD